MLIWEQTSAPAANRLFEGADGFVLENGAPDVLRFGSRAEAKAYAKKHDLIIHAVE